MRTLEKLALFFLHWLNPERAHIWGVWGLRLLQFPFIRTVRRTFPAPQSTPATLLGIRFPNRVGLAAGFDKSAEIFPALSWMGFGFIEVGTVTPIAQRGNPPPRLFRVPPESLINRMGFNNCGLERFARNVASLRRLKTAAPLLINVGKGKDTPNDQAIQDYKSAATRLTDLADAFVVNVSSPNTPGLRDLQSQPFLESLERDIPWKKPVLVKFAPDLSDEELKALLFFLRDSKKLAGVVLTNTSRALAEPWRVKGFDGGFSGPPLLNRSLECVALARGILPDSKLIVGVGGISSLEDAKEMREAGADLVEIYTAFIYKGPKLIRELAAGL